MPKIAVNPAFWAVVMLSLQMMVIGKIKRIESVVMLNAALAM